MTKKKTILTISAETHKGMVRGHNEDNHIYCPDLKSNDWIFYEMKENIELGEFGSLLVVADGMGGMNAGEVASEEAIAGIRQYFSEKLNGDVFKDENRIKSFLRNSILAANAKIVKRQKEDVETAGMGTTIILGLIYQNKVYISWSGDSRCYRYNQNIGLQPLSKDHSYVQELIDAGKLTEEQAFYHPDSNIVTQSLGDAKHIPKPDFTSYILHEGDKIILCSDGLNAMLQDVEIREVFNNKPKIDDCIKELISLSNKAGGHDNITVAIAEVISVSSASTVKGNLISKLKPYLKYLTLVVLTILLTSSYFLFFHDKENDIKYEVKFDLKAKLNDESKYTSVNGQQVPDEIIINKGDSLFIANSDTLYWYNDEKLGIHSILRVDTVTTVSDVIQGNNSDAETVENQENITSGENDIVEENTQEEPIEESKGSEQQNEPDDGIERTSGGANDSQNTRTGLEIIEKENKTIIKKNDSLTTIPKKANYDQIKDESDGFRAVEKGGKWGYINSEDTLVIKLEYDDAYVFCEGYAFVKIGSTWGVIDKAGEIQIEFQNVWKPENCFDNNKEATVRLISNTDSVFYININSEN